MTFYLKAQFLCLMSITVRDKQQRKFLKGNVLIDNLYSNCTSNAIKFYIKIIQKTFVEIFINSSN